MIRPALLRLVAGGLILLAAAGIAGAEPAVPSGCAAPDALAAIEPALTHAAAKIERGGKQPGEKLKIVAIGSSSTSGSGASNPNLTYPARLEAELRERYPHLEIIVQRQLDGVGRGIQRRLFQPKPMLDTTQSKQRVPAVWRAPNLSARESVQIKA